MIRKRFVLAMASSPPVPLDEIYKVWNRKEMFRFAQHDKIPIVIASKAKQSNGIESS